MTATRRAAVLVGAVACVVFAPAIRGDFVLWDDDMNFLDNQAYRGLSWTHLGWMFTTYHGGHWQPFSWITLALDWSLWGLDPAGRWVLVLQYRSDQLAGPTPKAGNNGHTVRGEPLVQAGKNHVNTCCWS